MTQPEKIISTILVDYSFFFFSPDPERSLVFCHVCTPVIKAYCGKCLS